MAERTFETIVTEWTETLIELNRQSSNIGEIALITRIGMLGQRLLFEANQVGMRSVADDLKGRMSNE